MRTRHPEGINPGNRLTAVSPVDRSNQRRVKRDLVAVSPVKAGRGGNPAQQVVDWATDAGELLARMRAFHGAGSQEARAAQALHAEAVQAARDVNVQVLANREGRAGFEAASRPWVEALGEATPPLQASMLRPPRPSSTYRPDEPLA